MYISIKHKDTGQEAIVMYAHNYGLTSPQMVKIENAFASAKERGKPVVLCGDFNFDPPGAI